MGLVGITATCGCYYVMSRHFVHHQSLVKGIVVSGILINLFAVIQDMGFTITAAKTKNGEYSEAKKKVIFKIK